MIVTVTLNPSMDAIYFTDTFQLGEMNRCGTPIKTVGGKGLNAGRTAAILGGEVTAISILAGTNGELIRAALEKELFTTRLFSISGESRNAVTIMDQVKNQTEIVEPGPEISPITAQEILDEIITFSKNQAELPLIALCGSANTENDDLYREYLEHINQELGAEVKILTDISGKQLKNVLAGVVKPYFIKPNIHEFAELVGRPVATKEEIISQLNHPLLEGIPFLLVSCGGAGAVVRYQQRIFDVTIPTIEIVNPTGSGDATVGGIAFALDQGFSIEETIRYGMACGMSNALEQAVGTVSLEFVEQVKEDVVLKEI